MKTANPRFSSKVQRNWDWRAAGNFICGGAGSGLVVSATLAGPLGAESLPLVLLGLALVAAGLFCVWLEIGRPWRALNVFKHLATSWMSREALVAPLLFLSGAAAWLFQPALVWPTALLAGAFLFSQSRILRADKGIPAWRHPRCAQLLIVTGLTEGCALLLVLLAFVGGPLVPVAAALLLLLGLRAWSWRRYREGLKEQRAPLPSQKTLASIDTTFLGLGHLLPAVLLLLATLRPEIALVAGLLAVGAGAAMKYTLIRKAAFTQGFRLQHQPVRGQRAPRRTPSAA
ncbi:DmsC/YnfH family molybdoenzyme membrane anchor subunit [Motiliproteus sp. SC1-56]|uniref:DmsC/YnfH family molybdoenzyme membrane anchor subunit n=1 Tax=Motiliproteus sp. SC1-56 TaxID=2799565 RepID=UPI001A902485|nr:DmsC/YnfH family molybdoenzyme membrane anchor subunit [Motiliproteus sp. SC1-56]